MNILITLVLDVLLHRQLVTHGLLPTAGHHHGLGLAIQQVTDVFPEMLNDDLNLLADVVWVQAHPFGQRGSGLLGIDLIVLCVRVSQLPSNGIGGVASEYINDEAFLNRLSHGVHMERLWLIGLTSRL